MTEQHPDLMAYTEGRLDQSQRVEAEAHLATCDDCASQARLLMEAVEQIDKTAAAVRRAFADGDALAFEAEQWLGSAAQEHPAELMLEQDQVVSRLPSELRHKVAKLDQDSLGARLRRSVEKLTGLGQGAARDLAERLGSGAMPAAAPAIRKDATKVEDDETSDDNQDDNHEQ